MLKSFLFPRRNDSNKKSESRDHFKKALFDTSKRNWCPFGLGCPRPVNTNLFQNLKKIFCSKFQFLSKNSILVLKLFFWRLKIPFLSKKLNSCLKILFLCKKSHFCQKFLFLCKTYIFVQKFHFCLKILLYNNFIFAKKSIFVKNLFFWSKNSIIVQKIYFCLKLHFCPKFDKDFPRIFFSLEKNIEYIIIFRWTP